MADAVLQKVDSIGNIASILNLIKGTSSTSTTKPNISPEGINAILQQILGGSQGLASVASGQRSAGLYNSTTNQLLTNDLITRTAGELAKQSAGSTTTLKTPPKIAGPDIGKLLLTIGGTNLLGPAVKGLVKKTGLDTLGTSMADALGLGGNFSTDAIAAANTSSDPIAALIGSQAGGIGIADALTAGGALLGSSEVGGLLTAANATADPLGTFIGSLGFDTSALGGEAALGGTAALGAADTLGLGEAVFGTGGSVLGGEALAGGIGGSVLGGGAALGGSVLGGEALAGGAALGAGELLGGAVAGDAAGIGVGDLLLTAATWVICTQLNAVGKLPDAMYNASALRAATLSEEVLDGYHAWAVGYTKLMRRDSWVGRMCTRFILPLAIARCRYLLGNFNIIGMASVYIGEPICWVIGKTLRLVHRKPADWRVLYPEIFDGPH